MKEHIKHMVEKFSRLFLVAGILLASYSNAMALSNSEERMVRLKVVELFEEYTKCSAMDRDFTEYGDRFRELFVSDESQVYNDLNYLVKGDMLTVKDYVEAMTTKSSTTRVYVKNINCKSINTEGDKTVIVCTFDKYVNITNDCAVELSSDFLNAEDYQMTAEIEYDNQAKKCLFKRIDGDVTRRIVLTEGYRVLNIKDTATVELRADGKPLILNAMGQAFLHPSEKITAIDPDYVVKLKEINSKCHLWDVTAKAKRWRIVGNIDYGFGDAFNVEKSDDAVDVKSKYASAGLDIGYIFPSKSKFKVGLFMGVGLSKSKMDMEYSNSNYSFTTNADVDGDTYTRHYQDLKLSQTLSMKDVIVPVYIDFDYRFSRIVSMAFDLGVRLDLNMSKDINNVSGTAYVYGIYPQYDNLRMDENWGLNGFGKQTYSQSQMLDDAVNTVKGFSANALGRIALRFNIPNSSFALELGGAYLYGITDVVSGTESENEKIVSNNISGLQSTEKVSSLTATMKSVKRQMMSVHCGLIYKF